MRLRIRWQFAKKVLVNGFEPVIGQAEFSATQQQRALHRIGQGETLQGKFGAQKTGVKDGVMRHQGISANEITEA